MCVFVDHHQNVVFAYKTYGIDHVGFDSPDAFRTYYPRKVRPNMPIDLVHGPPEAPVAARGNWGMNTGRFDWNARNDRLATSPLWSSMWGVAAQHVAIPISHGYEMTKRHGDRRWSCVKRPDGDPWWVAGLGRTQQGKHRTEWHVTMVTVDAGAVFQPIHDTPREIVMLRDWAECQTWLAGDIESCVKLLRAATPDVLTSYRVHDEVLRTGFPPARCPEPWRPQPQRDLGQFGSD